MFLRCKVRRKDGKQHRYWSVVENTRVAGGRVAQRHVLYLGEINDRQELAWRRSIAVLEDGAVHPRTLSLFPEDRCEGLLGDTSVVRVKLSELQLRRPRQWGACWLALLLWRELQLDQFWCKRLGVSRKEPALAKAGGRAGIRSCSCWSPTACWPHGTSPWAEGPRDARGRPAGALSGGHAEGALDAFGEASGRPAVVRGATRRAEMLWGERRGQGIIVAGNNRRGAPCSSRMT